MKLPSVTSIDTAPKSASQDWAPWHALHAVAKFGGQFVANPNRVGSVVPSMPSLGKRMAAQVPHNPPGYIVELGAGTGAITGALLKHGVPPHKLVTVDCSPAMAEVLRQRYPGLTILVGDAADLSTLLREHLDLRRQRVSHIISGLPLRSLPKPVVQDVAREVDGLLPRQGRFVQFTYNLRPEPHPALSRLRFSSTSVVWCNLPPARVNVYTKD